MSFWKKNAKKEETVSITAGGFSLGTPQGVQLEPEVKLITPANRDAAPANRDLFNHQNERSSLVPCGLGKGRVLTARAFFTSPVRIDGIFKGEIFSSSEVLVSELAEVEGKIEADKLTVNGKISKGQVTISDLLEARASARLEGKFNTRRARVAEGCQIVGGFKVGA